MPHKSTAMPPPTLRRKRCFIISPIGDLSSDVRTRSELVRKHIILPATKEAGYLDDDVIRADQIPQPGIITSQIIQHLYDDDLVIADLTDHNANVFYELAIRHATRKAVVLLIQKGQRIPFDVALNRVIHYNLSDWDSPQACAEELLKQIKAVQNEPLSADNPISAAMNFKALMESSDPTAQILGTLGPRLEAMEYLIQRLTSRLDFDFNAYLSPKEVTVTVPGNRSSFATYLGTSSPRVPGVNYVPTFTSQDVTTVSETTEPPP